MAEGHANNWNLIRLLAACQVMYSHTSGHLKLPRLSQVPLIGDFLNFAIYTIPGVPVFFIVSGFLVTQSFLNGSGGVTGFFWRRALRIYPGLWAHYVVIFVALAVTGAWSASQLVDPGMWKWIAGAFFIGSDWWANIVSGFRPFDWDAGLYERFPSGVLWTINAEIGFYLLVPLVFAPIWRKLKITWAIILLFGAASLWFAFFVGDAKAGGLRGNAVGFMQNQPGIYFWVFLLGATIGMHWERVRFLFEKRALYWIAAYGVLIWLDLNFFGSRSPVIDLNELQPLMIPRMCLLGGAVISFAYSWRWIGAWAQKFDLSYAIYLYHMLVVWTFIGFGLTGKAWLWPVVVATVFAIAACSWFLIERPAMGLKKNAPALWAAFRKRRAAERASAN